MFLFKTDEMPRFTYEYTHEKRFFKRDFMLFMAKAKDSSHKDWYFWVIALQDNIYADKGETIYLGKFEDGKIRVSKDFYGLSVTIQKLGDEMFERFQEWIRKGKL